jgi:hypothetical protein
VTNGVGAGDPICWSSTTAKASSEMFQSRAAGVDLERCGTLLCRLIPNEQPPLMWWKRIAHSLCSPMPHQPSAPIVLGVAVGRAAQHLLQHDYSATGSMM